MKRKHEISASERALFQAAVADTSPIAAANLREDDRPKPRPVKRSPAPGTDTPERSLHYQAEAATLTGADLVQFARPGIQRKTLRRLRRGQIEIEAQIDLHHLYLPEARQLLLEFLQTCHSARYRSALLVHGKGNHTSALPVLKNAIFQWLPQLEEVQAFCSAQPRDGGSGALYLLIKPAQRDSGKMN